MNVIRHARVLVVDDQDSVGRALQRILREYDVVALVNPREALARIVTGERFEVILCDVMMPEMSGCALHGEIMRVAPDQAERMIFITGGATTADTEDFLAAINQPVLTKPFDRTALRALIQQYVA